MTYDDFIKYIRHPENLKDEQPEELKNLAEKYPYFKLSRWLYLKSLHLSGSIYFGQELKKTSLHTANRRNLYYYIHPEELSTIEPTVLRNDGSGGYFDMLNKLDTKGENNRLSLQSLAEKLKAARETLKIQTEIKQENSEIYPENDAPKPEVIDNVTFEERERRAKLLVKEKKYKEAVEILEELNLINPKKSIYFADQIRFLKKIIQN